MENTLCNKFNPRPRVSIASFKKPSATPNAKHIHHLNAVLFSAYRHSSTRLQTSLWRRDVLYDIFIFMLPANSYSHGLKNYSLLQGSSIWSKENEIGHQMNFPQLHPSWAPKSPQNSSRLLNIQTIQSCTMGFPHCKSSMPCMYWKAITAVEF